MSRNWYSFYSVQRLLYFLVYFFSAMAEGGEDSFDNEFEPDDFLIDSDGEGLSDEGIISLYIQNK